MVVEKDKVIKIDYTLKDSDGETIDIAVARAATADDDLRIGSLVFNPGGPGGSGIEFLTNVAGVIPPELTERFDLVSFDPRGVGASTAIDCEVDFDDDVSLLAPGDDAGWDALVADAEGRVDTCTADSLALEPYVGTNNAARDLDALREDDPDLYAQYMALVKATTEQPMSASANRRCATSWPSSKSLAAIRAASS